jgi:hypothetical protein
MTESTFSDLDFNYQAGKDFNGALKGRRADQE